MHAGRPGIQASSFTDTWGLPYLLWDGEAVEEPDAFMQLSKEIIRIECKGR